jgi:hypothetical protein
MSISRKAANALAMAAMLVATPGAVLAKPAAIIPSAGNQTTLPVNFTQDQDAAREKADNGASATTFRIATRLHIHSTICHEDPKRCPRPPKGPVIIPPPQPCRNC